MQLPLIKEMDEIDCSVQGYQWLIETARELGCDQIDSLRNCQQCGHLYSAWKQRSLVAYYFVIRDPYNWSVLIRHIVEYNQPTDSAEDQIITVE